MSKASFVVALAVMACLGGCGAARQPAPATPAGPPAYEDAAPAGAAAPAMPVAPGGDTRFAPPPAPSTTDVLPERDAQRRSARMELDRAQRDLEAAASDCATACRALASMERATQHLCTLADAPDDQRRCDDAKQRLSAARSRVQSACGACP